LIFVKLIHLDSIMSDQISLHTIGVIGGGTAGFLSALAIKTYYPNIDVSLIESKQVAPIGVGEATTPLLVNFLHRDLKIDLGEFYKEVKPTHKQGIRFEWGKPGDYYFNYPFEKHDPYGAYYIHSDITKSCLQSVLMNQKKSLIGNLNGEIKAIEALAKKPDFAYHLDNKLFLAFLKKKALEAGVKHHYQDIDAIEKDQDKISAVVAKDGSRFSFDMYFDCSGFKSMLLEKTLKSGFVDYSKSLFTDRAISTTIPNKNDIKPYTTATTMRNGWLWNIPMHGDDHIGYVYSSRFCTDEEALEELKVKHPDITKPHFIKFRSGRHENSIVGNVMGIGNSFAFIEPLESTGIHMIIAGLKYFLDHIKKGVLSPSSVNEINRKLNLKWDHLKWFIALHFKYNKKIDSPFWRACQQETDLSGYDDIIDLYKKNGPLKKKENVAKNIMGNLLESSIFSLNGFDTFFIGQGIYPDKKDQHYLEERSKMLQQKAFLWDAIAVNTLSHKESLELIEDNPDLLTF